MIDVQLEGKLEHMDKITMLHFRRNAGKVLRSLRTRTTPIRLMYRGKGVCDLVPVIDESLARVCADDPFYRLAEEATQGDALSNNQIDKILYGGSKNIR